MCENTCTDGDERQGDHDADKEHRKQRLRVWKRFLLGKNAFTDAYERVIWQDMKDGKYDAGHWYDDIVAEEAAARQLRLRVWERFHRGESASTDPEARVIWQMIHDGEYDAGNWCDDVLDDALGEPELWQDRHDGEDDDGVDDPDRRTP
jgi:hypothetical protein